MKKIILFLIITIASIDIYAQTPASGNPSYKSFSTLSNDTLSYLKTNFDTNKSFYLNKTVSLLVNDFELAPLSDTYSFDESFACMGITLFFISKDHLGWVLAKKKYISISIVFITPIPKNEFKSFIIENRDSGILGTWDSTEKSFYGTRAVRDIIVSEYNN